MANEQNLIPQAHVITVEEASKGGINSGITRRKQRTLKEIGDMIGKLPMKSQKNIELLKKAGLDDEDMIRDVGMMFRLSVNAENGDPRSIELLAKLRKQLTEQVEQTNIELPKPRLAKDREEKQSKE